MKAQVPGNLELGEMIPYIFHCVWVYTLVVDIHVCVYVWRPEAGICCLLYTHFTPLFFYLFNLFIYF